ncbi:MAG: AraC family transcriptional regulator [Woeseiaceae bacterium]|nr:AraC family transcriptional regulator [Woeseiaceae bacterium]
MPNRYQDNYPTEPLLDSAAMTRPSAVDLLTLEYFEAEPASMPPQRYAQHHVLLNLKPKPYRSENWRNGEHRDFMLNQHEIIVTPAGMESGWRWHERSQVIVITLEPDRLERFAQTELGILLTGSQLANKPLLLDPDICAAGLQLKEALETKTFGSDLMFESLARVFLIKLIQRYGETLEEDYEFSRRFSAQHYKRVLDFVADNYGRTLSLEELAGEAALSPSHFSRLFKETIGSSPMQFVMSFRIERAKEALRDRTKTLVDIATQCGFSDQAHFSRSFKASVGQSPSAYRKTVT